jgi:hypothetical protein
MALDAVVQLAEEVGRIVNSTYVVALKVGLKHGKASNLGMSESFPTSAQFLETPFTDSTNEACSRNWRNC